MLFYFFFNISRVFVFVIILFHMHDLRLNTCEKLFIHFPVAVDELKNIRIIVWCNWIG
jgi:hypothetical protein